MKNLSILLILFLFPLLSSAEDETVPVKISTGEQFKTNTFQSYGWGCGANLFQEKSGKLHGAIVDNYKLYYFWSENEGKTWTVNQITTGYEGKVKYAGIVVNSSGKVFIPFEVHPNYNYGQSPISSSHFIYRVLCAVSDGNTWKFEEVHRNSTSSNFGYNLRDVLIDKHNKVHVFTERYGWYTYGGEVYENIFDPELNQWSRATIVTYSDTPVDNFSGYTKAVINLRGEIAIMFWRFYVNKWMYAVKPANATAWPTPQLFDTNPTSLGFTLVAGPDSLFHIVWVKGSDPYTLYYKKGFGDTNPKTLYAGAKGETLSPALHIDGAGKITVFLFRSGLRPISIVKPSADEEWSTEHAVYPYLNPISGLYNARTQQNGFTHFQGLSFSYVRPSTMPYGPDTLFFWQQYNLKELTLVAQPEGAGELTGAGKFNIESPVTVSAKPAENYKFVHWLSAAGDTISDQSEFTFKMPLHNTTLKAVFSNSANVETLSIDNPVRIYPTLESYKIYRIEAICNMQLRVVSIAGSMLEILEINKGNNKLNLTGKPTGIYALQFVSAEINKTIRVIVK